MSSAQLQLVMDSIVWAFRHTERNVAETGLNLLEDLLHKFGESGPQVLTSFHQAYFLKIMQEILVVMTGETIMIPHVLGCYTLTGPSWVPFKFSSILVLSMAGCIKIQVVGIEMPLCAS